MSLDKKYQIPAETVKKMVQDGVISCSIARHHEIYDYYLSFKSTCSGKSNAEIFFHVAEKMKVSESSVKAIVYKLDRNS